MTDTDRKETASGTRRRALFVINPNSRSGGCDKAELMATLTSHGIDLVECATSSAKDVSPAIVAHRDSVDCVIVGGGDGTLNAACRGLIETGLPLGVLPLGTANDFARSADIPDDIDAAIRIIAEGFTHKVDVGDVNGFPFFNVASVGLAADLARSLTSDSKKRFGRLSYALTAAKILAQATPFHATLLADGEKVMVKTLQIAVGNGRFYGGGNIVAPDARIDDGYLDLYSLEFSQVWRMALMIRAFKAGVHGAIREVRTARGGTFEVVTRKPRPVNADGELVTETPARFTQKLLAVTVYVPRACSLVTTPP